MSYYRSISTLVGLLLLLAGCALLVEHVALVRDARVNAYFSASLRAIGVPVASSTPSSQLELAYARELARRAPLMDLAGTDPAALRRGIDALASAQAKLVDAQKNSRDREAVESLYPLTYLRALANLEEARERFVASGAAPDRARYDSALQDAIAAGRHDLRVFKATFDSYAEATPGRFPTLGDTISTESMMAVLNKIDEGFDTVSRERTARAACLQGLIERCDNAELRTRIPDAASSPLNPAAAANVTAVRALLAAATHNQSYATNTVVALDESTCEGAYSDGPFYYLPPLTDPVRPPQFLNDLFFIPTQNNTAGLSVYMKDSLGMAYSRVNPSIYYICPDVGRDNALMAAVIETARIAQSHPDIAQNLRRPLLGNTAFRESDATVYLRAALTEVHDATTTNELTEAGLMFVDHGGNLESTVLQAAQTGTRDASLAASGVPFDLSGRDLFLTHSAFPTFFQFYNPSFRTDGDGLRAHDAAASASLSLHVTPYSTLREKIPEAAILSDLERFFTFEQIN